MTRRRGSSVRYYRGLRDVEFLGGFPDLRFEGNVVCQTGLFRRPEPPTGQEPSLGTFGRYLIPHGNLSLHYQV